MDYREYLEQLSSRTITQELAFPETEYRRRLGKVRGLMDETGLDVLLVTFIPNVCYMSGYQAFATDLYACAVVPREGEPTLQVIELEMSGAFLKSWMRDVRGVKWLGPDTVASELSGLLKERGLASGRIGIEANRAGLSVGRYEALKAALPGATFVDASDLVVRSRVIKSPAEIDHMRKAAEMTRAGIEAALKIIRPGVTENEIAAVGFDSMVREGSEYFSSQPMVAGAQHSGWTHTAFNRTPIHAGQTVVIEFGAAHQRYTSAIMHTVAVGTPSSAVTRLARASNDALDVLFGTVRPGRTAHDVALEVGKALKHVSAEAYSTGMYGYSIGLSFPPTWREVITYIAEGIDLPLQPGMTFHSPISLRIPGVTGIGFSETWVVTETGCEIPTKHDRELTVVPA